MPAKSAVSFFVLSRLGCFRVTVCEGTVSSISFCGCGSTFKRNKAKIHRLRSNFERRIKQALARYLTGRRISLKTFPLDWRCATVFQRKVWRATQRITYGERRSYQWIAKQIGQPKAARAVGRALHNNPFLIAVPCHRVVRKRQSLGGFRPGVGLKKALLRLESADKVKG